jgi:hypothetical protein
MTSKVDLNRDVLPLVQVLAPGSSFSQNSKIESAADDVDEIRRTLEQLTITLRTIDEGAQAFNAATLETYDSGSQTSFIPGSTPFGPVEEAKDKRKREKVSSTTVVARGAAKKSRANYPAWKINVMKGWLEQHLSEPYPSEEQREQFAKDLDLVSQPASNQTSI